MAFYFKIFVFCWLIDKTFSDCNSNSGGINWNSIISNLNQISNDCYGQAIQAPSGKYYCISRNKAQSYQFKTPSSISAYASVAFIRTQADFDDWKFLKGKYSS